MQGEPLFSRSDDRHPFVTSLVGIVVGVGWCGFGVWQAGKNWLFSDWLIGGGDGLTANEVAFGIVAVAGALWALLNVLRLFGVAMSAVQHRGHRDDAGTRRRSGVEARRVRDLAPAIARSSPFDERIVNYDEVRLNDERGEGATVIVSDRAVYIAPGSGRMHRYPFERLASVSGGGLGFSRRRFLRPLGAQPFEYIALWLDRRADGAMYDYAESRVRELDMSSQNLDIPDRGQVTASYRLVGEDGSGGWGVVPGDGIDLADPDISRWFREEGLPSLDALVDDVRSEWLSRAEHVAVRSAGRIYGSLPSELQPPEWGPGQVGATVETLAFMTEGGVRHDYGWDAVTSYSVDAPKLCLFFHPCCTIDLESSNGIDVWLALLRRHDVVVGNPFDPGNVT